MVEPLSASSRAPTGVVFQPPTTDDVCRALEQSAVENALPVEFFARVIWQESRFDARALSPKGAEGIAQFMPATASWARPCRSVRSHGVVAALSGLLA
jgi:soluble lytic murein transglycosylase-like protein